VYLHYVLDEWFEREVKPRMRGRAQLVRYADDAVMVFSDERDARRVLEVLPKRFGRFGLELHSEKTRLVSFRRPHLRFGKDDDRDWRSGQQRPGTFDMLGFTHYWGRSRKGNWVVRQKTAKDRLCRAIRRMSQWCRVHLHDPVREQWQGLCAKLRGHDAYYGVTGNIRSLRAFHRAALSAWRKWLDRRSDRARMSWEKMMRLVERYPWPQPRISHSYVPRAANP
jgi:RNA-directed DNA polymerase